MYDSDNTDNWFRHPWFVDTSVLWEQLMLFIVMKETKMSI